MTPKQEKEFLLLEKLVVNCAGALEIITREYKGSMGSTMWQYCKKIEVDLNELMNFSEEK